MATSVDDYFLSVIDEPGQRGPVPAALRGFLGGCAWAYERGLDAYLSAERIGLRRRETLPAPVVSIGNLTVGGTGKTPMTQWLCRRLAAQGKRVAVLSRGHGGEGRGTRLVSDGAQTFLTARQAGDEPVLLARTLPGVPVLVGKDRRKSGREALRRFPLDALVLDDGFQYWQLARDLDIVLLDARRPFDNGFSLPRGLLREPPRHLRRAGIVVVTRADALDTAGREELAARIARLAPEASLFWAVHCPVGLVRLDDGSTVSPDALAGKHIVALSGIAQPESFARTLTEATGAQIVRHLARPDHAWLGPETVAEARNMAAALGADALVMTEKDAVKWPENAAGEFPVYALRIEACVEDEARFLAAVQVRLFQGH